MTPTQNQNPGGLAIKPLLLVQEEPQFDPDHDTTQSPLFDFPGTGFGYEGFGDKDMGRGTRKGRTVDYGRPEPFASFRPPLGGVWCEMRRRIRTREHVARCDKAGRCEVFAMFLCFGLLHLTVVHCCCFTDFLMSRYAILGQIDDAVSRSVPHRFPFPHFPRPQLHGLESTRTDVSSQQRSMMWPPPAIIALLLS